MGLTSEQHEHVEHAKDVVVSAFTTTPVGGTWRVERVEEHPETAGTWLLTMAHGGPWGTYHRVRLTLEPMPIGGQPSNEPPF